MVPQPGAQLPDKLAYSPEEYFAAQEKKRKFGRKKKKKKPAGLPRAGSSEESAEGAGESHEHLEMSTRKSTAPGKDEESEGEQ